VQASQLQQIAENIKVNNSTRPYEYLTTDTLLHTVHYGWPLSSELQYQPINAALLGERYFSFSNNDLNMI